MDKQSVIGLLLIGAVLIGFSVYNSQEQKKRVEEYRLKQEAAQLVQDSIERVEAKNAPFEQPQTGQQLQAGEQAPAVEQPAETPGERKLREFESNFGPVLAAATVGEEQFRVLENDVVKLYLSNKGGRVAAVELKDYKTYGKKPEDRQPLMLFAGNSSRFDLSFFLQFNAGKNLELHTENFYFEPSQQSDVALAEGQEAASFLMRLPVDSLASIDFIYTLKQGEYMVDFDVRFNNMAPLLVNQSTIGLAWENTAPQTEKGYDNENNNTDIVYKYPGEKGVEKLGLSKGEKEKSVPTKIEWISFKKQFFSSTLIAKEPFTDAQLHYRTIAEGSGLIKRFDIQASVPFSANTEEYKFNFYFGPNKYSLLKSYDLSMERVIPLGGWIIGVVNRWLVIPLFDILGNHIASFGLIIFLLTLIVKLLIMPLTYKSYLSMAKMRLLKPEIEQINAKYPDQKDAVKKQQATMELYKKAGVSPMGGCLPMLIQFPIIIALFRFFPASIELRGRSFLWADDLSAYDSIWDLPFTIPFYGDHISLFALLMAVTMFFSSKINYDQSAGSSQQLPGMKFMMLYMMPVMMLLWFNSYASGLTYYYTLSSLITIIQTWGFRYLVDDQKLHAQMKANAKKPVKKSKFAQRYEEMLKNQQQAQREAAKKRR